MPTGPLARPTVGLLLDYRLFFKKVKEEMEQTDIDEIIRCISELRLSTYKDKDLKEYVNIIKKNQKIYPAMHLMEVIFRNKAHAAVSEILQVKDWLLEFNRENLDVIKSFSTLSKTSKEKSFWKMIFCKKNEIHTENEKTVSYENLKKEINCAYKSSIEIARVKKRSVIEGDLIAALTFGFWTTLFSKPYSNILGDKGLFIKTFNEINFNEIGKIGTKEYSSKESAIRKNINDIRRNRNRVFHHEKLKDYEKTEKLIWEIISQMSNVSHDYFFNSFNESI